VEIAERPSSSVWIGWSAGVVCALAAGAVAARLAVRHGYGGSGLVATIAALVLLLLPYFLLGTTDLPARLATWMGTRRAHTLILVALPLVPYFICASGTRTVSGIAILKLVGLALLPLALLLWADRAGSPPRLLDGLAVLAVWLPHELGWLRDIWLWPAGGSGYALNEILGVDLTVILVVSIRRLEGVGYSLAVRRGDLREAIWNLLMFACIAIPLGRWTGFIAPAHVPSSVLEFASQFAGIFLAIAVPEELLFRGLMQNLLGKLIPSRYALVVASVIFGLSHLNNGPAPDWRYVVLASIAGFFYGRAYQRSGSLMAACLVHAGVDTIWREVFR